jgi:hypothetical protein
VYFIMMDVKVKFHISCYGFYNMDIKYNMFYRAMASEQGYSNLKSFRCF